MIVFYRDEYSILFSVFCMVQNNMWGYINSMDVRVLLMILIVVMLVVCVLVYYMHRTRDAEHFDSRLDGTTREQCGMACTKILGCAAFGYDDTKKLCYLSKDPIFTRPDTKVFAQYYKVDMPRCNKLYAIDDPLYNSRDNLLRNATFTCKAAENGPDYIKTYMNKELTLDTIDDVNKLKLEPYTFVDIDWADGAGDMNTPNARTSVIDLGKNMNLVTNPTRATSVNVMKEYDAEILGQYLYPHECVSNISQKDCLKECLDNPYCAGTEWNPYMLAPIADADLSDPAQVNKYVVKSGVCCPKRVLSKAIPRTDAHKYGHMYVKQNVVKSDIPSDAVIVTYASSDAAQPDANPVFDPHSSFKFNDFRVQ